MGMVISKGRIIEAWLAAIDHLEQNGGRYRNLMLEINAADEMTFADRRVISAVDEALRTRGETTVLTVAGTIFPQGLYKRVGAADLAAHFLGIMASAKKRGTWGTYAMRLMSRPGREWNTVINPLAILIGKLQRAASPNGKAIVSNYELGVVDANDLASDEPVFCDVPLYSPAHDATMVRNQPCLMHLSFKLVDKTTLELTAIYRSHYYAQRALGNFIGLRHLMNFVAAQAGVQAGRLTCISTDASLDLASWGSAAESRAALQRIRAVATTVDSAPASAGTARAMTPAPHLVSGESSATHTGA